MDKKLVFKNFNNVLKIKEKNKLIKYLKKINNLEWPKFIKSFKDSYNYNYDKNILKKYKTIKNINIIGMGGSSLGTKAIYNFLINKIKKKVSFYENLNLKKKNLSRSLNIIISKSGNTLETIVNSNSLLNNKNKNIFIIENNNSYLKKLAQKLKSEIIEHKDFIGGRFSVLSEVGMLPSELMGLNPKKFKQYNNLIINKKFLNELICNTLCTYQFIKQKKMNSVILNYDPNSEDFLKWYQQLIAESLGKKSKGIMPIISTMPKDNHSLLQLYLSGFKSNFYTFFTVEENKSLKLNSKYLFEELSFLKEKNTYDILNAQRIATENLFSLKKIPFRTFYLKERSEENLGKLFCFFTLEVILLSHLLKVNPLDQPEVELVKKGTFKILKNL